MTLQSLCTFCKNFAGKRFACMATLNDPPTQRIVSSAMGVSLPLSRCYFCDDKALKSQLDLCAAVTKQRVVQPRWHWIYFKYRATVSVTRHRDWWIECCSPGLKTKRALHRHSASPEMIRFWLVFFGHKYLNFVGGNASHSMALRAAHWGTLGGSRFFTNDRKHNLAVRGQNVVSAIDRLWACQHRFMKRLSRLQWVSAFLCPVVISVMTRLSSLN